MSSLKETLKNKVSEEQGGEIMESPAEASAGAPIQPPANIPAAPDMAVGLEKAKDRIEELQEFIKYMMVPSIDYGFIPGCSKPMLFKSGAEKLCDIYGLSKAIEVTERLEDWDKGVFHYEVKAILINKSNGRIEAEGIGSCNSREKKYASQNPYSIVNSILKMAKKRAIVDATLTATRTSGIFAQDLDSHAA